MKSIFLAILFSASAVLLMPSATKAGGIRIVPSEPLHSNATVHEAKGRNGILIRQKLSFGPFFTTEVKRGWIKSWSGATGIPGKWLLEETRAKQAIHFSLSDGSDTVHAQTLTRTSADNIIIGPNRRAPHNVLIEVLSIGSARQSNNLTARFALASGGPEWQLFLDNTAAQLHQRQAAGFLESEAGVYTIYPVWRVQTAKGRVVNMPFASAGLELVNEQGRAVAAVSLIDGGEVHLDGSLDEGERLILSAACSALLLQSVID